MDYILLLKILTEWSLKNKEYDLALIIYKEFNIGIPVNLLYKLPQQNIFYSLSSFNTKNEIINYDNTLEKLFSLFLKSKYTTLQNWSNKYGYIKYQ
jgi:hypothetical protein